MLVVVLDLARVHLQELPVALRVDEVDALLVARPSQACNAKTARSISPEQVKQVGNSWGKALAHEKRTFHR